MAELSPGMIWPKKAEEAKFSREQLQEEGSIATQECLLHTGGFKAWTRTAVNEAADFAYTALHEAWHMKEGHREEWVTTMEYRLLNMQRHVFQALSKSKAKQTEWIKEMPYYEDAMKEMGRTVEPTKGSADSAVESPKEISYVVKYDTELLSSSYRAGQQKEKTSMGTVSAFARTRRSCRVGSNGGRVDGRYATTIADPHGRCTQAGDGSTSESQRGRAPVGRRALSLTPQTCCKDESKPRPPHGSLRTELSGARG